MWSSYSLNYYTGIPVKYYRAHKDNPILLRREFPIHRETKLCYTIAILYLPVPGGMGSGLFPDEIGKDRHTSSFRSAYISRKNPVMIISHIERFKNKGKPQRLFLYRLVKLSEAAACPQKVCRQKQYSRMKTHGKTALQSENRGATERRKKNEKFCRDR